MIACADLARALLLQVFIVPASVLAQTDDPASLDRLHDISEPAPVFWWPPAPGWYVIAALLLILAATVMVRAVLRLRANLYRWTALARLDALVARIDAGDDPGAVLVQAAELGKRTALAAFVRTDIASLSGARWVEWLNRHGNGVAFHGESARLLADTVYRPAGAAAQTPEPCRQTLHTLRHWIRKHRLC
jgi:hypothetical protein